MIPDCPKCKCDYTYEDSSISMFVCPTCGYEWNEEQQTERVYKDANGNILKDGDSVTVIKDLKVNGAPKPIKQGTKVKKIRLVDEDHDIDCKIDGFGAMKLKSEFVKKI